MTREGALFWGSGICCFVRYKW